MRAKDKCPSCFQPVAPTDFLCANCELILDPSQIPERPVSDVSVVRRMLEAPQRGMTSGKPNPKPPRSAPSEAMEGPTKRLDLGPELAGVPVVVATLTRKSVQLSEFEAWVVSLIDGLSDAKGLAKTAGVRDFELRVVLRTLHDKHIIDFADEPLSDADLEMPSVMGTLDEEAELQTAPGFLEPPPPPPPVVHGANADRRDGRFVAPSSRAAPPPLPDILPPAPVRAKVAAPPFPEREPIIQGKAEPPVLTPVGGRPPVAKGPPTYPGMTAEQKAGLPPSRAVGSRPPSAQLPPPPPVDDAPPPRPMRPPSPPPPPVDDAPPPRPMRPPSPPPPPVDAPPPPRPPERTDPRIAYTGPVNRKVLDALKKVKRVEPGASAPSAAPKEEKEQTLADVLARDTLQVALRMEQGGRLDEAIRFLEKSIAQSPDAASLYNRLGIILMRERADYRRAETLIRKAIDLAPDNTVYSTNLRQVLSKHAMKQR